MLRAQFERHPLASFLLLTFAWSWGWDAVFFLFGWWDTPVVFPRQLGLPIAAAVVVWARGVSPRKWFSRVLDWRLRPAVYVLALAVPLFVTNVQQVLRAAGGGSLTVSLPGSLPAVVLFLVVNMFLLGGAEEIGWRGYLQPRLQERTSVLTAGVTVGVVWWLWHLPLFFTDKAAYSLEPLALLTYTTFIVGASVVLGAFVNVTGGRVVPAMLLHATINLGPFLDGSGGALDDPQLVSLVVGSGLWWLIVAVLVLRHGVAMVPHPDA